MKGLTMKGLIMNWIKTLLFLMIAPALTNDTERCEPFKALFIWHTSNGTDASFYQGKRLLISVINSLPQGTDVILKTIGAEANIDKQVHKNTTWKGEISLHKPGTSGNHVISSNDISEAVFKYLDQNDTPKRAEEVFLIVNDKSVIDNKGRVEEALRKKKTFVVVYGELTDVWTNLATDKNHLIELDDDNLNSTIKSLRNLSCKDARLLCDTDQYWTGERCYRCTYICSSSPSEYCLKDCRYTNHSVQDTNSVIKTCVNDQNVLTNINTRLNIITGLISVLIFVLIVLCLLGLKFFMMAKSKEIQFNKKENAIPSQFSVQDSDEIRDKHKHVIEMQEMTSNTLSRAGDGTITESYYNVRRDTHLPTPSAISDISLERTALV